MVLTIGGKDYQYKKDMVMGSSRISAKQSIKDSELVFVGYGVNAPEYNWNDYEGLDVKGKTVVMLVNDPGFATKNPDLFTGDAMTYYGRWTYKYEEASRQGAAGAIIIHETAPLLTHGQLLKTLGAVSNLVSKKKITTWTVLLLKAG